MFDYRWYFNRGRQHVEIPGWVICSPKDC